VVISYRSRSALRDTGRDRDVRGVANEGTHAIEIHESAAIEADSLFDLEHAAHR